MATSQSSLFDRPVEERIPSQEFDSIAYELEAISRDIRDLGDSWASQNARIAAYIIEGIRSELYKQYSYLERTKKLMAEHYS